MGEVFYSGKHSIFFESSELCVITYDGPLVVAEVPKIHDELKRWAQGRPRFFILVNLSSTGNIEPAARKVAAETLDMPNITAVLSYGQSWPVRVAATLTAALIRAIGKVKCPFHFFATEKEARAWLERNGT